MAEFKGVQLDILTSKHQNQLVSAGAGSGKTTIMIEKISNLIISEGVSIDNLLVVTFTVLAAQEMKDRLIAKLREKLDIVSDEQKQKILDIMEKVKTASIDTIDGFASKTIKKYFYDLEISPNVEIVSDASRDYYISIAMRKTLDEFSKHVEDLDLILDLYGGGRRNLKTIEELILNNYFNIVNIEDWEEFLLKAKDEYIDSIKSENIINSYICNKIELVKQKIINNSSNFAEEITKKLNSIYTKLNQFNRNMSFKTNLQFLESLELENFSTKEYKENIGLKELNAEIKEIEKINKKFKELGINIDFDQKNSEIINILTIFLNLLSNFINNYNSLKSKNNLIDFNDLNRLMLKLLDNEKIRKELQEKYKYIFLDEYQDVSPLQDALLSRIVGVDSHVFMVGDVKQSIYGFRGASPEWFLNKYDTFKTDEQMGKAYDMNVNFRSSPTILNFINDVFSRLMTKRGADIDYAKDCMIEPKRDDIIDEKVKIMLVSESERTVAHGLYSVKNHQNNKSSTAMKEAVLVLKIITDLIGKEFYDAKKNIRRPMTYSDIAILSRSEKDESARLLIDVLKENAVPLNINNKLLVEESEGIKILLSIVKCVIGTADDVDYLATFLALTELDIDDIVTIRDREQSLYENLRSVDDDRIRVGFEAIEDIRLASYTLANREIIRYILDDKKVRYYILRKLSGEKELKLIEEFLSKLSIIEDSLNLAEFIDVIESGVSKGTDFETSDDEDSVTIQTIHKSKGLEYPVVILYNSSKEFSYIREHDGINFNTDIGFGLDHFDRENRVKSYSITKYAIKLKNDEKGYKEELRLLYVALTRAKNKLYITGSYKPKDIAEKSINKTNYTNCILSCFIDGINQDRTEFNNCEIDLIDEDVEIANNEQKSFTSVELVGDDFEYPNMHKFGITFKNTVTGINSAHSATEKFETKRWLRPDVQYDSTEDRALIGTHYHKALEMIDLKTDYEQNTEFEDVDYDKIKHAHEVLSKLVGANDRVKKEAEFMLYVPYNSIVESEVDDKVLVQGVVDLIIEHEDTVEIVDYKFSSLPIRILKQKYSEQLALYKLAVEKAFNKKVTNTFIYSINTGELY